VPLRFTVARDDITPGETHFFHALVKPPENHPDVPVVVDVSGNPMPPETEQRRHVVFTFQPSD
jgi:hypothetical protein